ncbi:hypothetical protein [Methylobacterium sp. JK268]
MPTNTAPTKPPVRSLPTQQVHYLRKTVTFADANLGTGVPFKNAMPVGAIITGLLVVVEQAFNAGTTNVLTVGSAPGGSDLATGSDTGAGTVGAKQPTTASALGRLTADTVPYVTFTSTGAAPTAGVADIVISYVPQGSEV